MGGSTLRSSRRPGPSPVPRLFAEIASERGDRNEAAVDQALNHLKQEGSIDHWFRTERHSFYDRRGVDFVALVDGEPIPIQVKSSKRGLIEHQRRHPGIPGIVVKSGEPNEKLRTRLRTLIAQV